MTEPATDPLIAHIRAAAAAGSARIERIEHAGQTVWIKRPERPRGWRRLQKGNGARAFDAERRALETLAARGAPVPRVLDQGRDHIAMADSGVTLNRVLTRNLYSEPERLAVFAAAGLALADLHACGAVHGRPSPKDMAWDGTRITFLDFERWVRPRDRARAQAMDLILFTFGAFAITGGPRPEIDAALAAFATADGFNTVARAKRICQWIAPLARTARLLPRRSRDVAAVPLTIAAIRDLAAGQTSSGK